MEKAFYEILENSYQIWHGSTMNFESHLHRQVEIIYILDGELEFELNWNKYSIKKGELAIFFPNQIHSYHSSAKNQYIMLIFDVYTNGSYGNYFTRYECKTPLLKKDTVHNDVIYSLKALIDVKRKNTAIVNAYFALILGRIFPVLSLNKIDTPEFSEVSQDSTYGVIHYISLHYTDEITLEDIAESLNLSKYTVSRILNEKIKSSFNSYINLLRVNYSKDLLKFSNKSILDIAMDSGFNSQRTFNRAFKNIIGESPREFRNKKLGAIE
ncbi:MAG: AraC family transcriptional regulator [Lachnospirales bacterium]